MGVMIAYVLGLIAGIAQPTQTSCNGKISSELKSPYITTFVSTATAILLMLIVLFSTEGGVHIPFAKIAEYPLWIWCGGFCGTVIIITSIACLPKLGSAITVLLTAFGQILTGVVVDNWGLFESKVISFNMTRLIGSLLVIVGVVLVSRTKEDKSGSGGSSGGKVLYVFLAILCGIACGVQVAINGTLGVAAESPMRATLISMCFAMLGITLLTLYIVITKGKTGIYENGVPVKFRFKWWMVSGGMLGTLIVATNAIVAPVLGTGLVNILNLVGEMGMGLFIDAIGFLGIEKKPVTVSKVFGMFLMIAGTAVISFL